MSRLPFGTANHNTFGVGAPLVGLPVYAVLDLFVDIDRFWWWHGAALTASLLTALAALFVLPRTSSASWRRAASSNRCRLF